MRRLVVKGTLLLALSPIVPGLTVVDLQAQRWSPFRNRYYRPYYRPSTPAYYRFTRPFFYRVPTRPYFYYPPKHYPRAAVPYRGYELGSTSAVYSAYPAHPSPLASVVGNVSQAYYLNNPSVSYYPEEYRGTDFVVRANFSHILFKVSPGTALIYLDDKLIGSARSFASEREKYEILEGEYRLRIENPGFRTFDSMLSIQPDQTIHLDITLERSSGTW